jgi:hypothetical protein
MVCFFADHDSPVHCGVIAPPLAEIGRGYISRSRHPLVQEHPLVRTQWARWQRSQHVYRAAGHGCSPQYSHHDSNVRNLQKDYGLLKPTGVFPSLVRLLSDWHRTIPIQV